MSFGRIGDFLFRRIVVCSMGGCGQDFHRAICSVSSRSGCRLSDTFGLVVVGQGFGEALSSSMVTFYGEEGCFLLDKLCFFPLCARAIGVGPSIWSQI